MTLNTSYDPPAPTTQSVTDMIDDQGVENMENVAAMTLSPEDMQQGRNLVRANTKRFPALGDMQLTLRAHRNQAQEIRNHVEETDEFRAEAAKFVLGKHRERHAAHVEKFEAQVAAEETRLRKEIFGSGSEGSAYRESLMKLQKESDEDLETHLETALLTGDGALTRAVRTLAHQRGNKKILYRSFRDDAAAQDKYTEFRIIPGERERSILTRAFAPQPFRSVEYQPSIEERKAHEKAEAFRRRELGL